MWLFSGASIAEFEQAWSRNTSQPTFVLMERAAAASVAHIRQRFTPERPVVVLCGKGNNGGDGLLVALLLQQQGWPVYLWLAGEPRAGSDAERAWQQVQTQGMEVLPSLTTGSGLVTAMLDESAQGALLVRAPEVMASTDSVPSHLGSRHVVVVGPGFGRDSLSAQRWQRLCDVHLGGDQPWLVDADALFHLAHQPIRRSKWVLTPHPGEAARLLGCSVAEVEVDRLAAADQLQVRFGGVVVLKGAGSVIASDQGCWIVPLSVGAMATAGMGDVLSGVIGALMAQGLTPTQAAQSGTYLMAFGASEMARKQPVVRATDLLQALPAMMHTLNVRSGYQSLNLQR